MLTLTRVLVVLALLAAACSGPDTSRLDACGPNGECPEGESCVPATNRCTKTGASAAPDAAPADATPPDAPAADAPAADAGPGDAPAPATLALDPPAPDFGAVALGATSAPLVVTVQNGGSTSSAVLAVHATDDVDYAVTGGTCPGSALAPAATCTLALVFHPTGALGPRAATLVVTAGGTTLAAALTGRGLAPGQLSLTPASIGFGNVAVGTRSAPATFTVTNRGQLATGPLAVTLGDPGDFIITASECTGALAAGASCTITVVFTPAAVGLVAEVPLTVTASPGGSAAATLQGTATATLTVSLAGTGGGSVASQPAGIDCGAVCSAALSVDSVTLTATPDATSVLESWGGACSGTGACVVTLDAARSVTATFQLRPASLVLTPASHDFGAVALGAASGPVTFMVTNHGGARSPALAARVDGADFVLGDDGCSGRTLDAGASCTVAVRFTPTGAAGPRTATLTIGGLSSTLTGAALTPAQLSLDPATIDLGPAAVGGASGETVITVENSGQSPTGALALALAGNDVSSFAIHSSDCSSLAPGATCHVGVVFAPTSEGPKTAALTVATGDGAVAASLAGRGTATLVVVRAGDGAGTVTSAPPGIACGSLCSASFDGSPVGLSVVAGPLSRFAGWSGGGCSGTGSCDVVLANATTTVTATFELTPAALAIAPAAQDLGAVVLGDSADVTFTVTNGGGAPSGALQANVDDAQDWAVTGGTCLGQTLASGASCTVDVRFAPLTAGDDPATLTVGASPGAGATAALAGKGLTAAQLVLSPPAAGLNTAALGSTGASQLFTVENTGQSPSGVPLAPQLSDADDFIVSKNTCTAELAPGARCTVGVTLRPETLGLVQSRLTLSASPGGVVAAALDGTGSAELVVANGSGGTVAVDPGGLACASGITCPFSFTQSPVTVAAAPDGAHTFAGWSGGGCGTAASCTVALGAATTTVTASYALRPAALAVAPAAHDFSSVTIGATASTTFTVTNTGGAQSGAIAATVDDTADFSVTGDTCPSQGLGAGASCTVAVRFAPVSAGARTATLTLVAAQTTGASAALSGTGLEPAALAVTPASFTFPDTGLGGTSAEQRFTVTNNGQSPSGAPAAPVLSDPADFAVSTNGCTAPLAAGDSCTVAVRFAPSAVGARPGTVTIAAAPGGSAAATLGGTGTAVLTVVNGAGGTVSGDVSCASGTTCNATFRASPASVTATPDGAHTFAGWSGGGCGTAASCAIALTSSTTTVTASYALRPAALSVAPTEHDFGSQVVGGTASTSFDVTNTGGATSGALAASVDDTADFGVTDGTCLGRTLAGGASCTVTVRFAPASAGAKIAILTLSGAQTSGAAATLSGTGLGPAHLTIHPTTLVYPATRLGSTSTEQIITVTNDGQTSSGVPAAPVLSDAADFVVSSNGCTGALAPGASCAVGVRFAPSTLGSIAAKTLTVSASPGGSAVATVSGDGFADVTVMDGTGGTITPTDPSALACSSGSCSYGFKQSPVTFSAQADSTHVFGGWTDACSAATGTTCTIAITTATTTIGATWVAAPTVTITSATIDTQAATASFAFSASGGDPTCHLDGAAAAPCTSPQSFTDLAPGPHTFTVSATNVAGTGTDSRSWSTDAWVDAASGADTASGNTNHPFRHIGAGLGSAATTVRVRPGLYDQEQLPLTVDHKMLIGDIAHRGLGSAPTEIRGTASLYGVIELTAVVSAGAIKGFWIVPGSGTADTAVWIDDSNGTIASNTIDPCVLDLLYCADGITVQSGFDVLIQDNVIQGWSNFSGPGCGIYFNWATAMAQGNQVTGFPVADVAIVGEMVDLGGGGKSSGGNTFQCAGGADVSVAVGNQTLSARNNYWDHAPPTSGTACGAGVDFCSASDTLDAGSVAGTDHGCP